VVTIINKMRQNRLKRPVLRREETDAARLVKETCIKGKACERERPKKGWAEG